jgi:dolichol-phosphate mannosyltransferase
VFVPTYQERLNAPALVRQLRALGRDLDLLFIDDASPDGTGALLEALAADDPHLHVVHRPAKLGIGSAHRAGIAWAYAHGYERLVTLDGDFTHSPADIPRLLERAADGCDVVVGSRFMRAGTLPGWRLHRRLATHLGHVITRGVLGIPHDATTAFRVYDLRRIPATLFDSVESSGYSFFLESMFRLVEAGSKVEEVPIVLPARVHGSSKMGPADVLQSVARTQRLLLARLRAPARHAAAKAPEEPTRAWDAYWSKKDVAVSRAYDVVAEVYRRALIRPRLTDTLRRHFPPGAALLHAGCGSGQVDVDVQHEMRLTGLDISPRALDLYRRYVPAAAATKAGDLLDLPFADAIFDGVYNLGVIEHLTREEILRMLGEMRRVLRPGGKVVIFWPHVRSPSVLVLHGAQAVLDRAGRADVRFHPPEISLLESREAGARLFAAASFAVVDYDYGPRDLFVQAVYVLAAA